MDDCGAKRNRRVSYEEAEDEGGPVTRRKLHAGSPGALATPAPRAVTDLERSGGQTVRNSRSVLAEAGLRVDESSPWRSSQDGDRGVVDPPPSPSRPASVLLDMHGAEHVSDGDGAEAMRPALAAGAHARHEEAGGASRRPGGASGTPYMHPEWRGPQGMLKMASLGCDETAASAFRNLGHSALQTGCTQVDKALGGEGLAHPTVLELVGPSGAGKTEFLLGMCVANILPKTFQGVFIGGPGASIVYFSVGVIPSSLTVRLVTLLDLHLLEKRKDMSEDQDWSQWRTSVIDDCLSRVHIVACSGTVQLLSSVRGLPTMLKHNHGIRAIVFDCLSTLQWFDKSDARRHSDTTPTQLLDCALGFVQAVARDYRLLILGSRWSAAPRSLSWANSGASSSGASSCAGARAQRQSTSDPRADAFGKRWQSEMVTYRITFKASISQGAGSRVDYFASIKSCGASASCLQPEGQALCITKGPAQ